MHTIVSNQPARRCNKTEQIRLPVLAMDLLYPHSAPILHNWINQRIHSSIAYPHITNVPKKFFTKWVRVGAFSFSIHEVLAPPKTSKIVFDSVKSIYTLDQGEKNIALCAYRFLAGDTFSAVALLHAGNALGLLCLLFEQVSLATNLDRELFV